MNLNKLAIDITKLEGKKKSLSVAQVKEVLKIALIELAKCDREDVVRTLNRYRDRTY